jgi:hypothetical protein
MKTKQTIFAYVIASLLTAAFVCAATRAAADCQPTSGTTVAIIGTPSPSCPVATVAGDVFDDDDNLIGTTTACLSSVTPSGNGALHVMLGHTFNLGTLVFTTEDQLVLAPIAPPLYRVNNSLTIVSGASGFLRTHGTVNFATGEVNLRFNGLICTE